MASTSDRIEKKIVLRASPERVWRAISDAEQFGTWFGVEFDGPFAAGAHVKGKIVPTKVDPEVARRQEPHNGMACDITVVRMEAEKLFSFRWQPGENPAAAAGDAPTTLVEFALKPVAEGTLLTITESGFERIPLEQRAKAFADNEGGWEVQTTLIAKYLAANDA
jgi:uncharacterized protein YndB with AHSA1/START domain